MVCKPVVKMGNLQLMTPSEPLHDFEQQGRSYPGLIELIDNMKDTMKKEGGVGIAAPQIGYNQRVIIFGFDENERYPDEDAIPFTVLINPSFKSLSDEMVDGWEGCLSLPGLRGLVSRYQQIEYRGYDLDGQLIVRKVEGFHARVIQHECDHLDGILYLQRVKDLKYFGFEDEIVQRF